MRATRKSYGLVVGAAAAVGMAGSAWGQMEVIYSTISGANSVPPDRAGTVSFSTFSRPFFSQDGTRWVMRCTDNGATGTSFMMRGQGTVGEVIARRNNAAPWSVGNTIGLFDDNPHITNTGVVVFGNNLEGTSPTIDEYVVRYDGAAYSVVAVEGDAAPGLMGVTLGSVSRSTTMSNDGRAGYMSNLSDGGTALFFDGAVLAKYQDAATAPTGQDGGATNAWSFFFNERFQVSPDGSTWMIFGDVADGFSPARDALAINNDIKIQEQYAYPFAQPSPPATVLSLDNPLMDSAGNWWCAAQLGADATSTIRHMLVRNGSTFKKTGDAITPSATEVFTVPVSQTFNCFSTFAGTAAGDYAVAASTDGALASNHVLIANDVVLARENDAVTLPGGAMVFIGQNEASTNRFTSAFSDVTVTTTHVYAVVLFRNAAGVTQGRAFARWPKPALPTLPCPGDFDGNGAVEVADIFAFLNAWFSQFGVCTTPPTPCSADIDGNGAVEVADIFAFLNQWFGQFGTPCP